MPGAIIRYCEVARLPCLMIAKSTPNAALLRLTHPNVDQTRGFEGVWDSDLFQVDEVQPGSPVDEPYGRLVKFMLLNKAYPETAHARPAGGQ